MKPKYKVIVLSVWTVGVILIAHALRDVIGGQFREQWFLITSFVLVVGALFIEFLRWIVRMAKAGNEHSQEPVPFIGSQGRDFDNALQGKSAMADNSKVIIQSPGVVNIHNNTTHNNVQGGIIGNGTVNVHQHFDKAQADIPPPPEQFSEPVKLIPVRETASVEELRAFGETLMGYKLSDGTIRNILQKNDIVACGEEKRGKTSAKIYPREHSEKAVSDYVVANKNK